MKHIFAMVLALSACQLTACEMQSRARPRATAEKGAPVEIPAAAPVVRWPADRDSNQLAALTTAELRHLPVCDTAPPLTADSIGPLAPGRTATQVLERCPGSRLVWDWGKEGVPEPAMVVHLGAGVIDVAFEGTLPDSRAYRLVTADTVFRTSEGIGPGSHFGELLRAYGPPDILDANGCVLHAGYTGTPGLTWRLHVGNNVACEDVARIAATRDASLIPRSALVESVSLGSARADSVPAAPAP